MGLTYDRTKPAANDRPSNDQAPMQTNFASIQTLIDVDHIDFDNGNYGMHDWVQMPYPYAAGTTVPFPRIFTSIVDGKGSALPGSLPQFFMYNGGTAAQSSTQNNVTATNGSVMLPMGIILKWGSQTFTGTANTTVLYTNAFPNACFGVWPSILNANYAGFTPNPSSPGTLPPMNVLTTQTGVNGKTGFTGKVTGNGSSGNITYFWCAIGN